MSSTNEYEGGYEEVFVVKFKDGFRSLIVIASRMEDDLKIELHDTENNNQKEEEDIIDGNDVANQDQNEAENQEQSVAEDKQNPAVNNEQNSSEYEEDTTDSEQLTADNN